MNTLSLRIDRKKFNAIRTGEVKTEIRYIYPNNADKYVIQREEEDEEGLILHVDPVHYDAIVFINGRRKDEQRMTVKLEKSEFFVITDDNGEDMTYEENGEEYYVCMVEYTLGEIISTENI